MSITTRIRPCRPFWRGVPRGPGGRHRRGTVNAALQLVRPSVGVAGLDVLHGAMKYAPTDRGFDELGEVALLHPSGAQKSAQREVGFLGDLAIPGYSSGPVVLALGLA